MAQIKDLKRMCKSYSCCSECELCDSCTVWQFPDNIDEIADKWVEEHSVEN